MPEEDNHFRMMGAVHFWHVGFDDLDVMIPFGCLLSYVNFT